MPSLCDGSFEYPQHMFWLRNEKINYFVSTHNLSSDTCHLPTGLYKISF